MPQVIMITGPSGAGKSATAAALAASLPGTWALVSQDDVRALVKAGFANPEAEWTNQTRRQWEVSVGICCDMIRRYHGAGIGCVAELFAPPAEFGKWRRQLAGIDYMLFVLLPGVEETVRRNAGRERVMNEDQVRENYGWFTRWAPGEAVIIDTTRKSLAETVGEISRRLAGGPAGR